MSQDLKHREPERLARLTFRVLLKGIETAPEYVRIIVTSDDDVQFYY